jgi:hypothetical protein
VSGPTVVMGATMMVIGILMKMTNLSLQGAMTSVEKGLVVAGQDLAKRRLSLTEGSQA